MKSASTTHATLRRVVGNSASLAIGETVARTASLVTIVYVSRVLAPDGMGVVEFGLAVHGAMWVVATGGADVLLIADGARGGVRLDRLAGQNVVLGWVQVVPVLVALLAAQALAGRPVDLVLGAAVFGAAATLAPLGMRFAFVAGERARVLGIGSAAGFATYLALCLLVVRAPDHGLRVGLCFVTAMAVRNGLQLAVFVRRHGWPSIDGRGLASRVRLAVSLGAGSAARGLMLCVDVLVLGLLCAPREVAAYGLATKVPLFLASLAGFHYLALFPTLARALGAGDDPRAAALQSTSIAATLGVALPGALCLAWAAGDVVSALFTSRFAAAGPILAILVWRVPMAAITGALRTALWGADPARDVRVAVGVLLVTLVGLPAAIASGGPRGAAVWMLACDGLALAAYARSLRSAARPTVPVAVLVRLGLAIVVAAVLLAAAAPARGPVTVMAAIAIWSASACVGTLPYARRVVGAWRT